MKKILIVLAIITAALVCFFTLAKKGSEGSAQESTQPSQNLSLYAVADNANMVRATSVGLGKKERHRVISGRLYQNFVQLLKTNGRLNEKNVFTDDCKEGLVLEFYRDTVLLGNFRMTSRIGRDSVAGVWETRHMAKVNKFLKDQAIQFVACPEANVQEGFVEDSSVVNGNQQREILTMPKFGAARKSKKNEERNAALDSVAKAVSENAALTESLAGESQNALVALSEMIMPADTAIGEPLAERIAHWNRVEVVFFDSSMAAKAEKEFSLDENQMKTLAGLLKRSSLETFAMSDRAPTKNDVIVTLFKDNAPKMELWEMNGGKFKVLLKRSILPSGFTENEGFWIPEDSAALQSFFASLK